MIQPAQFNFLEAILHLKVGVRPTSNLGKRSDICTLHVSGRLWSVFQKEGVVTPNSRSWGDDLDQI